MLTQQALLPTEPPLQPKELPRQPQVKVPLLLQAVLKAEGMLAVHDYTTPQPGPHGLPVKVKTMPGATRKSRR